MAFFVNVVDLQAALSACLTVRDWEVLFEAPFAGKIYLRYFRLFVTIIDHYRQKTKHTHIYTQSGAENSIFQVCLTITRPFSPIYLEEIKNY